MTLSRRHWLALAAGAAGATLATDAFGPEARDVELTRLDVPIPGLPEPLDGLRVALVTDVHLPANRAAAARALALLDAERPDLVLHAGDLLEEPAHADALARFAARARGALGTFATMGNWEWSAGIAPAAARRWYGEAGVRFLHNEHAIIERDGARLAILGLDDPVRGHPDPARALDGLDDAPRLWVVHAPAFALRLPVGARPSLVVAGHTHGGQVRVPFLPPYRIRGAGPFVAGSYNVPAGRLYVSRGVGTSGIRARFRCPAELPLFTLRRA